MERIISNKIQCKHCREITELKSIYDFVWCKCAYFALDGGKYHLSGAFRTSKEMILLN